MLSIEKVISNELRETATKICQNMHILGLKVDDWNEIYKHLDKVENIILKKGGTHDLHSIGTSQARLRAGEGRQVT